MNWIFEEEERVAKRTLGIRDKQILYRRANKKCENPTCNKKLEFDEMQVGHKTAWSRGGSTTLKNSVCLCYRCNKLQGTDSWPVFLRKQGVEDPGIILKKSLMKLNMSQLKTLAKKHGIILKNRVIADWFETQTIAPTKTQYVNKLSKIVNEKEIDLIKKEPKKPIKRRKKQQSSESWFW
jgi:hypothetical protein